MIFLVLVVLIFIRKTSKNIEKFIEKLSALKLLKWILKKYEK
jgi:hypothetical protein